MTTEEYNRDLEKFIEAFSTGPGIGIMVKVGNDALALIKRRIIGSGQDADGAQYAPYSTKPMLSGCKNFITQNSCTTFAKDKDTKWVSIGTGDKRKSLFVIPGGYKQFRELNGRQSGFVDFSFSGRMWADIAITSTNSDHADGLVTIAAKTDENDKKLAGNTKRRTDILKLSQSEIELLSEVYNAELNQVISNMGL